MVTPIGAAFMLLAALVLAWKRQYAYVLAVGMLAPAGYAFVAGTNGIPVFYLAALGAALLVVLSSFRQRGFRTLVYGRGPLLGFVVWCSVVTVASPVLFEGIPVLTPRQSTEYGYLDPGSLGFTVSNFAQLAYLILCVFVVFFLGRSPRLKPGVLGIGLSLITILSFAQVCSYYFGIAWPDSFFVNNPSGRIIDGVTGDGDVRFRGVYTEPSSLAIGSLASLAYFVTSYSRLDSVKAKVATILVIAMCITNLAVSTSSTAILGAATLGVIAVLAGLWRFVFCGARIFPKSLMIILIGIVPLVILLPTIIGRIQDEVSSKVGGTSFETRMGGNLMSFDVLVDTFLLGAGLGSHKPYALWANLIANAGLPGTLLFVALVVTVIHRASRIQEMQPTVWALIAVLVAKSYAGSGLGEPIIWMSIGLLANAVYGGDKERVVTRRNSTESGTGERSNAPQLSFPTL